MKLNEAELTKDYIYNNLFNVNKSLNTNLLKKIKIPNTHNWCKTKSEYIFAILNDLNEAPICFHCKRKKVKYISNGNYNKYCSISCGSKNEERKEKIKQTNQKKYGVDNPMQSEEVKNKVKETNQKKYGVDYYVKTEEMKNKSKKTNKKKYGVDNPMQSEEVKNKVKQTNQKKYGVNHPMQSKEIKEKQQFSVINNNLKNYNRKYFTQNQIKNIDKLTKEFIEENFVDKNLKIDFDKYLSFFNFTTNTGYKYLREKEVIYKTKTNIEQDINIIFNNVFETNNRTIIKPYELDLFNNNIAIEYNGLNYHSFGKSNSKIFNNYDEENIIIKETKYKNKDKTLYKTILSEKKGVHLFHIFENEWLDSTKKEIWISKINNKLKINQEKLFARNCYIKEAKTRKEEKEMNKFIKDNHLQGIEKSKIKIGLYTKQNNQLVTVITFGIPRYNKKYEWELIRLCSLKNTIVIGGSSKLLKYFEKTYKPKNILSYGNRRWTNKENNVYEKLGFDLINISIPNFYYFNEKKYDLKSRIVFQKYKLKKYLEEGKYNITSFDENLTGTENMYNNGYRKIYDSGNLVYVKEYKWED